MPIQYRQIPDEAVKAIVCRDVFWRYQQRDYEQEYGAIFSQGIDPDTAPVMSVSRDYEFNVSTSAGSFITTTNSAAILESMISNLSSANLLLNEILQLEESRATALQFKELASKWKKDVRRRLSSSAWEMAMNPDYLAIIGMGPRVIPLILEQLQSELDAGQPDHWFLALWSITQENPVPESSRGKVKEMARAWLAWGKGKGVIGGGVGVVLP